MISARLGEFLKRAPVITDGAWGTQLQAAGLQPGECPDGWNLSRPEEVERVARSYVEAGSAVILTNTFRSNKVGLAAYGLADQVVELNQAGTEVSRRAAEGRALVFASMGPTGKMIVAGELDRQTALEAFTVQARVLADAGADGIVIETMTDLSEALIALEAAKSTNLPVAVSLVFDSGKKKDRTMAGDTPEQAAAALVSAGADIVGANCGLGIEGFVLICRRMRAVTDAPIWIKPNAGLPVVEDGRMVYKTTPDEFASQARLIVEAGASFIGGCCGTAPEFIRALVGMVQGFT